jgi:hypothetical protein
MNTMTSVNGYLCRDCADVELAKRGIDPAHPKKEPQKSTAAAIEPPYGENQPMASGAVGTHLNLVG